MGERIAVIGESVQQEEALLGWLREAGYEVTVFQPSPRVHVEVRAFAPQMVIYDCSLPYGPIESIFLNIRNAISVPILVLGGAHHETFVVNALRLGADGCLCAPFGKEELLARVEAHLRRCFEWQGSETQASDSDLLIRDMTHTVIIGDREVRLTPTEYRLLKALIERNGDVVSREELQRYVWGQDNKDPSVATLSPYIYGLRKKLERDPHRPQHLLTKWGLGYCFDWRARKT